jgi:hypothetical protein
MRFTHSIFALIVAMVTTVVAEARILSSAEADGRAQVSEVITGHTTDLVVLAGGYNSGLRPGAVCTVTREGRALGSVIIAEANEQSAVALILSLDSSSSIKSGDTINLRPNPRI